MASAEVGGAGGTDGPVPAGEPCQVHTINSTGGWRYFTALRAGSVVEATSNQLHDDAARLDATNTGVQADTTKEGPA